MIKIICLVLVGLSSSFPAMSIKSVDSIKVTVSRVDEGSWMVEYQLPKAVDKVYFYRSGSLLRDGWRLEDSNLNLITNQGDQHAIDSKDGSLFQNIKIYFNSDFRTTDKNYELNFSFSDGGLLLYTGHLVLALSEDSKLNHEFHFMPYLQSQIVLNGKASKNKQQWLDHKLEGTYVYYGHSIPIESEHMLAVIDTGMPIWLQAHLKTYLPKLFAFYTKEIGIPLGYKPMIFFSYKPDEFGSGYTGSTLPGLVQLNLLGDEWKQNSQEKFIQLVRFLAHESAHLWNSRMVVKGDADESWMHEGGADAFAFRAIADLGIIEKADVLNEHEMHLNHCIDGLKFQNLTSYEKPQDYKVHYDCGATIALLTEFAVTAKDNDADLFNFWADLLERIIKNDLILSTEQYLKSLLLRTKNTTNILNILDLLDEPQDQPIEFFIRIFHDIGLTIKPVHGHPKKARNAIDLIIRHLVKADDCQGGAKGYYISNYGSYLMLEGEVTCQQLKPNMQISHILDLAVGSAGHAIHALVSSHCHKNLPIQLRTKNKEVIVLNCKETPPPVKPWLSIVNQ